MNKHDKIYLQYDNGEDMPVTWSKDQIYDSDVEYVRSGLVSKQQDEPKHETVEGWNSIRDIKPPAGLCLVNRCRMFEGIPVNKTIILNVREEWTREVLLEVWDYWLPLPEPPVNQ